MTDVAATDTLPDLPQDNPFSHSWSTPFGLPPFDSITPEHFTAAYAAGIAAHNGELEAIAHQAAAPTFANTLEAMELAGRGLRRVARTFANLSGAHTNDALQKIEREVAPTLAAHHARMFLDQAIFARLTDLFEHRDTLALNPEQARLLERYHTWFVKAGAALDAAARNRVAAIQSRLATLATTFNQNVLKDEQSWHLLLDEADLSGLPKGRKDAASKAASDRGHDGKYAITLARSSVEGFLTFSDRRDLREQAFKAWAARGATTDATDNRAILAEIVALRLELAKLFGFKSYADYALQETMAKTPAAVADLLQQVWTPALRQVDEERAALAKLAQAAGDNAEIAAWDWRYYTEKERRARYDLDDAELRPYFALDNMIQAAFDTATKLFGLQFAEVHDAPTYHDDVRVFAVTDADGQPVATFLGDYFARSSKRSGAWMSAFRGQQKLASDIRPIIVNVMNAAPAPPGEPVLISFSDAETLFHEFGHALHGMLSDVTYPSLAGTSVARDFVELPSQLFEHWLRHPTTLKTYARHVETNAPMPDALLERLHASRNFNQGFATVEYTASALVDMALHTETEPVDIDAFERTTLDAIGMPNEIIMRHRLPHFTHITGGYAAGYYSYMWSEVMDADAFAAFEETGDIYDPETAARLKAHIYAAGNQRDPKLAYQGFRGRDPDISSLLKKRGFVQ